MKITTKEDIALKAWEDVGCPDWVLALARACDRTSQGAVSRELGRSTSLVSTTIGNTYKGDLKGVEARVRAILMSENVDCPVLGRIPSRDCQLWQDKAAKFGSANALRVQMYRACNRCPKFKQENSDD